MNRCPSKSDRRLTTGITLILALMVCFVFGQTISFGFVNYDDDQYVYANKSISDGITLQGLHRIITQPHSANWHPFTSASHMLDCQLYSLTPAGHHLGNVILHLTTVILLFLVMRSMTGSLWRSAFVAALFAIHPLRAESVAWISERKDVLSGFFFMLTLGAYLRYTRSPFSLKRYAAVLLLYLFGLLSKPMLVTVPFLLLLLDWWPLKRFRTAETARLFLEKIPFLLLAVGSCAVTIWAQQRAVAAADALPFSWRQSNAVLSCVTYIKQSIVPTGLAALYPAPRESIPLWKTGAALIVLVTITLAVIRNCRKRPYLLTGWFWYLGMLVPVLGILQVGKQAHADRYTYLPQIGLTILAAWLAGEWTGTRRCKIAAAVVAAVLLVCLTQTARIQVGCWRDSYSLWTHTLSYTEQNYVAHSNLGIALFVDGRTDEAISHFEQALRIEPRQAEIHNNLAAAYAEKGRYMEASMVAYRALTLAEKQCDSATREAIRVRLENYLMHVQPPQTGN